MTQRWVKSWRMVSRSLSLSGPRSVTSMGPTTSIEFACTLLAIMTSCHYNLTLSTAREILGRGVIDSSHGEPEKNERVPLAVTWSRSRVDVPPSIQQCGGITTETWNATFDCQWGLPTTQWAVCPIREGDAGDLGESRCPPQPSIILISHSALSRTGGIAKLWRAGWTVSSPSTREYCFECTPINPTCSGMITT